jgi:hypothetical protein
MTPHDRIRSTLARYCQYVVDQRYRDWSELFDADGVLHAQGKELHGRAAIQAYIEETYGDNPPSVNLTINSIIDVTGSTATATSEFVTLKPHDGGFTVKSFGRYRDLFVERGDEWLIAERRIVARGVAS